MSPKLNHVNLGEIQRTAYLTGTITSVDSGNDTACFAGTGNCPAGTDIPIFYHCSYLEGSEPAQRSSGALEGAAGAFSEGDEVIVRCEIVSDGQYEPKFVIGFVDKPKQCEVERVYITMRVGTTDLCFVWNVAKNTFADIKLNAGGQASFPCDPDDISDWENDQVGVGASLYSSDACGRQLWACGELVTGCPPSGWGTAGTCSGSKEEESNCGCDFMDTGESTTTWDLTENCNYPGDSGASNWSTSQNILWRKYAGGVSQQKKLTFLNNKEGEDQIENAFRIELQHDAAETRWACEGAACGDVCDNIRLDSGVYSNTYKFHTPLELNILEINHACTKNWDCCNDSGAHNAVNELVDHRLQHQGSYSEGIIAQLYTAEAQTVTYNMNGAVSDYGCCGNCTWQDVVYTNHGLKITAQVGVFKGDSYPDGTDGVDPTGLSRNSSFESAIIGMYNSLRTAESVPDDEMANAVISLSILKG